MPLSAVMPYLRNTALGAYNTMVPANTKLEAGRTFRRAVCHDYKDHVHGPERCQARRDNSGH